jgi:hypothetical protein
VKVINAIRMGGADVLPIIEGGKGVAVSNGASSGAWASAGGVGTFSGVNPDSYDEDGRVIRQTYFGKTRRDRHEELVAYGIAGGVAQAREAHERAGGQGRIHANILWEMGGAERVIRGVLEGAKGLVSGITCGAGMPYRLADIAREFGIFYYPSCPPAAPSPRCGSAATTRPGSGWVASCTRTPGWPAATTACRTARIRSSRKTPSRAC